MKSPDLSLYYRDANKQECYLRLAAARISIGRDPMADVVLENARVTRMHCEIQLWDADYVIKDLHSKNGTFVNDRKVDVSILHVNDIIKVGPFALRLLDEAAHRIGETQAGEVLKDMNEGKGYNTILHEIVDHLDDDDTPDG